MRILLPNVYRIGYPLVWIAALTLLCLSVALVPAAVAAGPNEQRLAAIQLSSRQPGKPRQLLCEPTIVFLLKSSASFVTTVNSKRVEVSVRSQNPQGPLRHIVETKVSELGENDKVTQLVSHSLVIGDGQTGSAIARLPNGEEFELQVTIEPYQAVGK